MMLFRVMIDCVVKPFPQVCHGAVYVTVRGTDNEKVAKSEAERLATHRCWEIHRQEKHADRHLESCSEECLVFRAFPHTVTRLSWKGVEVSHQEYQPIISTIMGGDGEALTWHPIGKTRKVRFYRWG